jgi:hypothetical protein
MVYRRAAVAYTRECLMLRLGSRFGSVAATRRRLSAYTAYKTSEFLNLVEQTDVVPLDAGPFGKHNPSNGKKAEEMQTVRIASSLPFVPCRSRWGESCL